MLYDLIRHEPPQAIAWDEPAVRQTIARIVDDAEARFTPEGLWPPHPRDLEAEDPAEQPFTPLYFGACGVVWALHYLQDLGALTLRRNYLPHLNGIQQRNRAWHGGQWLPLPQALSAHSSPPWMCSSSRHETEHASVRG